jgi:hypothetical protein
MRLDVACFGAIWTPAFKHGYGPNRRQWRPAVALCFELGSREQREIIGMIANLITRLKAGTIAPGPAQR